MTVSWINILGFKLPFRSVGWPLLVRFLIGRVGKYVRAFYADELASFDSRCRQNVINQAAVCAGCRLFSLYLLPRGQREFHKAQGRFPG